MARQRSRAKIITVTCLNFINRTQVRLLKIRLKLPCGQSLAKGDRYKAIDTKGNLVIKLPWFKAILLLNRLIWRQVYSLSAQILELTFWSSAASIQFLTVFFPVQDQIFRCQIIRTDREKEVKSIIKNRASCRYLISRRPISEIFKFARKLARLQSTGRMRRSNSIAKVDFLFCEPSMGIVNSGSRAPAAVRRGTAGKFMHDIGECKCYITANI